MKYCSKTSKYLWSVSDIWRIIIYIWKRYTPTHEKTSYSYTRLRNGNIYHDGRIPSLQRNLFARNPKKSRTQMRKEYFSRGRFIFVAYILSNTDWRAFSYDYFFLWRVANGWIEDFWNVRGQYSQRGKYAPSVLCWSTFSSAVSEQCQKSTSYFSGNGEEDGECVGVFTQYIFPSVFIYHFSWWETGKNRKRGVKIFSPHRTQCTGILKNSRTLPIKKETIKILLFFFRWNNIFYFFSNIFERVEFIVPILCFFIRSYKNLFKFFPASLLSKIFKYS